MHRVAVLVSDSAVAVEVATVVQVFAAANFNAGHDLYEVGVVGGPGPVASSALHGPSFTLVPDHPLAWAAEADTVVIPGHAWFLDPPPQPMADTLLAAHGRGARVAALCVGAFILASTGMLDGRSATTHWLWAADFAERFPAVDLRRADLFVGQDGVYTAAGVTAALDLTLHLLEDDLGAAAAAAAARFLVAPMRREGGQAQYIEYDVAPRSHALDATLHWAADHLKEDLTVADLAHHAHMSSRTLTRHFRAQIGEPPMSWLLRTRVQRARELLESTDWPVDVVAAESGFRSTATFRHHFGRITSVAPGQYRRAFGNGGGAAAPGAGTRSDERATMAAATADERGGPSAEHEGRIALDTRPGQRER